MMHLEEGEKRSFWKDTPVGLSVVRTFDKVVLAVWLLSLVAYFAIVFGFNGSLFDMSIYDLLAYIAIPFAVVGLIYIIDHKNITALMAMIVVGVAVFILMKQFLYVLIIIYLMLGALGVACIVDALQRVIFYRVVGHIRYANVKEKLTLGDRFCAFLFNVPPDLDTRNIAIEPKKIGTKFAWRDMGSTVVLSLIVGMFFWIYISMNPSFVSMDYSANIPIFIFGVTMYVPIIVLPFSVFKSLNVKITTSYRDFSLYNGAVATIYRMAVPIFAAMIYVLQAALGQDDPFNVILYILYSTVIILFVVFLTSIVYYYAVEATTSADISNKWKLFMPVPLLMNLHEEVTEENESYPGTPTRDESDMSEISLRSERF